MFEEQLQELARKPRTSWRAKTGCTLLLVAGICVSYPVMWDLFIRPIFFSNPAHQREVTCISNMKALALSTIMYIQDWDEKFAPATQWHDLAMTPKYVSKEHPDPKCPSAKGLFSYGLNSTVAGQGLVKIDDPEKRVMLFEMDANTANAVGGKANLPDTPRHGHDIFAFVDGHAQRRDRTSESVKW